MLQSVMSVKSRCWKYW